MPKKDYTPLLKRLGLAALIIATSVGFFMMFDFEVKKGQDTIRMIQLRYIQDALSRYYMDHAGFPAISESFSLNGDTCLSGSGFVSMHDTRCAKKLYAYGFGVSSDEVFLYTPLEKDRKTSCVSKTNCPWYAIRFLLDTNSIFPKGERMLTPIGIQ